MKLNTLHIFLFLALLLTAASLSAQNFRVQIAAYNEQKSAEFFKEYGIENYTESSDQLGLYRYFAGAYETLEEAERVCKQIVAKGFPHAHVVDLEVQKVLCGAGCPYFRNGIVFNSNSPVNVIFFDFGRFSLTEDAKPILDFYFEQLRDNPRLKLLISGYADGVGSAEANLELSTERARAARNYLAYKGIRADRMQMEVFGEANPLMANKDEGDDRTDAPKNRKWNRRVVLKLVNDFSEAPSDNAVIRQ